MTFHCESCPAKKGCEVCIYSELPPWWVWVLLLAIVAAGSFYFANS